VVEADIETVCAANPGEETVTRQGAEQGTISFPASSVRPSSLPEKPATVAPGKAAPLLSSTVTVRGAADCALRAPGASAIAVSARAPNSTLNGPDCLNLIFRVGEKRTTQM
jgi:hypothetical protein